MIDIVVYVLEAHERQAPEMHAGAIGLSQMLLQHVAPQVCFGRTVHDEASKDLQCLVGKEDDRKEETERSIQRQILRDINWIYNRKKTLRHSDMETRSRVDWILVRNTTYRRRKDGERNAQEKKQSEDRHI